MYYVKIPDISNNVYAYQKEDLKKNGIPYSTSIIENTYQHVVHLRQGFILYPVADYFIKQIIHTYPNKKIYISKYDRLLQKSNPFNQASQVLNLKYDFMLYTESDYEDGEQDLSQTIMPLIDRCDHQTTGKILCTNTYLVLNIDNSEQTPSVTIKPHKFGYKDDFTLMDKINYCHALFPALIADRINQAFRMMNKSIEQSEKSLLEMFNHGVQSDILLIRLGGCAFYKEDFHQAINWWEQIHHKRSADFTNLGIACMKLLKRKEANQYWLRSLKLESNSGLKQQFLTNMRFLIN